MARQITRHQQTNPPATARKAAQVGNHKNQRVESHTSQLGAFLDLFNSNKNAQSPYTSPMTVSLNQLEKAHAALQRAIAVYDRVLLGSDVDLIETTRSGVIQNFEVVYEQSWKLLRRWMMHYLGVQESDLMQRRQLYRLAAKHGLLADVEAWWDFHEARNMTSHTYSPPIALEVAIKARLFDAACGQLINQLKAQSIDE
jgi:nucleotidyltransferase substrate binding protein (TIGR01987 family)